jgi:hypothetical protein
VAVPSSIVEPELELDVDQELEHLRRDRGSSCAGGDVSGGELDDDVGASEPAAELELEVDQGGAPAATSAAVELDDGRARARRPTRSSSTSGAIEEQRRRRQRR